MAKKNIDFEVYERQDESAQVNWTKAAADLTTTLTGIRDDRITRKDALNQEYLDTQDIVNDLGQYDNTTVQTLVMNIANGAGEMATNFYNEVKAGRAKPSEQNMFMHNLSTDFTLLKKNALGFDTAFKKFAEREQLQISARAEGWWAGQLTGFASLDNYTGVTDSLTGKISLIHKTDKTKNTTLQQLTLLMNQQIDAFDKKAQVALATSDLGVMVESEWNSKNPGRNYTEITKEEQTAFGERFIEDNKDNEEFQDFIKSSESLLIGSPQQQADMLATLVPGPDGKVGYYKNGSQDDFDAWEKEHPADVQTIVPELPPGDMTTEGTDFRKWIIETYSEYATENLIDQEGSNDLIQEAYAKYGEEYAKDVLDIEPTTTKGINPYMVQSMGKDGLAKVEITDEQDKASKRLAKQLILRAVDSSYTVGFEKSGENAPAPTYKPKYEIDSENEVIESFSDIDQANMLLTGGNDAFQNASQYFASKINRDETITRKLDPVTPFDRSDPNFLIINFADGSPSERISRYQTDEGGNVIMGPNGAIPADLKRNISSLLSMAGTGTKNSNQVMSEYVKQKGAVKSLNSDDQVKSSTAVTKQKPVESMNISDLALGYEDGKKITLSDKLTTIFKAGGADEKVIGDAATEVRKAVIKGLKDITTDIKVDIYDYDWSAYNNAIIVTINGEAKTIEFNYKTGQNTLLNGVQDAVNDAIKKIKAKAAAEGGTGETGDKEVETESGRTYK